MFSDLPRLTSFMLPQIGTPKNRYCVLDPPPPLLLIIFGVAFIGNIYLRFALNLTVRKRDGW